MHKSSHHNAAQTLQETQYNVNIIKKFFVNNKNIVEETIPLRDQIKAVVISNGTIGNTYPFDFSKMLISTHALKWND